MPKWKTMQYVPMQADQIWRDRIYSEKILIIKTIGNYIYKINRTYFGLTHIISTHFGNVYR